MKRIILTYLILCTTPIVGWCQDEFYVNDEIELNNIFSVWDSKMLDTVSVRFETAKTNVLEYCNENLNFDIESTATIYSCMEYMDINSHASKKEIKIIERKNLKYEFFISFKINQNITYNTSYYLDTAMQVQYSSKWLFNEGSDKVWNITSWEFISEKISKFENGYILPIQEIDIEYSERHEKYVYVIIQKKTKKTTVIKTSETSGNYELNKLIVDAENGVVLEKNKQGYSYIVSPSW